MLHLLQETLTHLDHIHISDDLFIPMDIKYQVQWVLTATLKTVNKSTREQIRAKIIEHLHNIKHLVSATVSPLLGTCIRDYGEKILQDYLFQLKEPSE